MSKILVIEDELPISRMLCLNLGFNGHETVPLYDGEQVLDYLARGKRGDLALLDVMLPKVDGFALLRPLTERGIPVIFLTARGDLESKVSGLRGGAEDYLVKPFDMLELAVRMEKVLARHGAGQTVYQAGDILLDTRERTVKRNGAEVAMTPMEFDLLLLLMKNRNVALSRDRLLDEVWGARYEGGTRTVDVHVAQLRKKTGANIVTVPKIGYRLED